VSPSTKVADSITLSFPKGSEAGQWTLSSLFVADAAGNTTHLDADQSRRLGLATFINVKSVQDMTPPKLTMLRIAPEIIDTRYSPADAKIMFSASDDLSGVESIEIVFSSPSGVVSHRAKATFPPNRDIAGSVDVNFPAGSELGQWTASVLVTDASGNTLHLDREALSLLSRQPTIQIGGN
jgi:hypothetical protein